MTKRGGWQATGFGERLRAVREERGLSQFQLAIKAECRVETVSRLERGEQEPAWPLVLALADALGVSTEAFRVEQQEKKTATKKTRKRREKDL